MMKKCLKHPKYKGRNKPKHECLDCLNLYLKLQKPRMPIMPTKVIRDKTKYTRKEKHKNKD